MKNDKDIEMEIIAKKSSWSEEENDGGIVLLLIKLKQTNVIICIGSDINI